MSFLTEITGAAVGNSGSSSQLVAKCPRCGVGNITFKVTSYNQVGQSYGWRNQYELFATCTACGKSSIFLVQDQNIELRDALARSGGLLKCSISLENFLELTGYIGLKHNASMQPPEHVPQEIADIFREGATCMTVDCWNAASAMFRLCVDLATVKLLPERDEADLNPKVRRDLGLRLPWLFKTGRISEDLHDLSTCIKDDGNDGVHRGTLEKEDALDMQEFTVALLGRLYTDPERIRLAKERTKERRTRKS